MRRLDLDGELTATGPAGDLHLVARGREVLVEIPSWGALRQLLRAAPFARSGARRRLAGALASADVDLHLTIARRRPLRLAAIRPRLNGFLLALAAGLARLPVPASGDYR